MAARSTGLGISGADGGVDFHSRGPDVMGVAAITKDTSLMSDALMGQLH